MATIEKIKRKKFQPVAPVSKIQPLDDENDRLEVEDLRPGSKASVISVQSATAEDTTDNTEKNDPFAVNTVGRMSPVPGPSRSRTPTRPSSSSPRPITPVRPSTPSDGRPITPTRPVTPSRPLTPSSRPITPQIGDSLSPHPQEPRSSTPVGFKRHNTVEPTDISSLKSHQSTIKDAWTDENERNESKVDDYLRAKSPGASVISVEEARDENRLDSASFREKGRRSVTSTTSSSTQLSPPAMKGDEYAYIPYTYAKNTIAKIMDDMKRMKNNHIQIVYDIELAYKGIEDETQAQFNAFVLSLRKQYQNKVQTFRQVVHVHRLELSHKSDYWDEALTSLSQRNRQLLQDKKALMIKNKVEFDRLEKEKQELMAQLTFRIDAVNKTSTSNQKEYDNMLLKLKKDQENEMEKREEERRVIEDQWKTEQEQVRRLRQELEDLHRKYDEDVLINETGQESRTPAGPATSQTVTVVTDLSEEERLRMEEERRQMSEQRDGMMEERKRSEEEREKFNEERKRFLEDRVALQGDLVNMKKESGEWQARYESLRGQLGDLADLRAKYAALEAQMAAMAFVATVSTEEDKKRTQEKIQKTQDEKDIMSEELSLIKKDIEKWEEEFKQENGREPKEEEKPEAILELETQKAEVDGMLVSLDTKIDTLDLLQQGKVPEAPQIEARPIVVTEPEIITVEVAVADPEVAADLLRANAEVEDLGKQLSEMKERNSALQSDLSELQSVSSKQQAEISRLEATIKALEEQLAQALAAGATGNLDAPSLKDQENLRREYEQKLKTFEKEKKALQKDLKKLLKQHQQQPKGGDSDIESLKFLLQALAQQIEQIHGEVGVAVTDRVDNRLGAAEKDLGDTQEDLDKIQEDLRSWETGFREEHGKEPTDEDRNSGAQDHHAAHAAKSQQLLEADLAKTALEIIKTGQLPEKYTAKLAALPTTSTTGASTEELEELERKISELEEKVSELESENEDLNEANKEQETKIEDLEQEVEDLKTQLEEARSAPSFSATSATYAADDDHIADSDGQWELQRQVDHAEAELREERRAHEITQEEVEALRQQIQEISGELEAARTEHKAELASAVTSHQAELLAEKQGQEKAKLRIEELEKAQLKNLPVDTAKEIKKLQGKLSAAEKERTEKGKEVIALTAAMATLQGKADSMEKSAKNHRNNIAELEGKLKSLRDEKDKAMKQQQAAFDKKEQQRASEEKKKVAALEKKIKDLESRGPGPVGKTAGAAKGGGGDAKTEAALKKTQEQLAAAKKDVAELNARIKAMDGDLKKAKAEGGPSAADKQNAKKQEKILKELEKKLESEKKKNEKNEANLKKTDAEVKDLTKGNKEKEDELKKLKGEMEILQGAAADGIEAAGKVKTLEAEVKKLTAENTTLGENFNSERVLRKKYYNMVEDMKGKIRVYCRARPLSGSEKERGNFSILKSPDEYSISCDTTRGTKDFQFDQIFMPEQGQEKVFEDTNNLIQSAVDGYNVCIFAYGQTGSGKTFTMIGDKQQKFPGVAPRAFTRIFDLLEENKSKFNFSVATYMLELYNEKLIDLYAKSSNSDDKLDIKKDKKGMVVVNGAEIKKADSSKELFALFEAGSANRHVASTKMNAESSRSHLVLAIIIESTNKTSGQVTRGKLSLVDLAGSERAAKTGATAEQLKEANSINKSLSALGDVISALSSDQSFIPYRNNKLTMLMQDSLGGNAKTLMFVNISPADYNADETVISLTYASRVKLITNDASKNADNKEIAKLKATIAKLKKGETLEEED